ncbi:DUF4145 domain-containing protein [Paenibacillus residui]|uniref:DUF4145 domain-containing protein n=1 Tax=Paenibacillus residui TaxID=629724 RepID=A0ABW3DFV5_9BACL
MDEIILTCFHCGNKTSMKRVASHELTDHDEIFDYSFSSYRPAYVVSLYKRWNVYICPVCKEITVERVTSFSEEIGPEGEPIYNKKLIYPMNSNDTNYIPDTVNDAFVAALKVRHLDGAVCIMALRRTLEKMCKDKEAKGKDLFDKLKNCQRRN